MHKIEPKSRSKVKAFPPYRESFVLALASFGFFLIGFLIKPSNVHVPSMDQAATTVNIWSSIDSVSISDITSVLTDDPSSYSMTGMVNVPPGKRASVYVGINGSWKLDPSSEAGWRVTNSQLTGSALEGNFRHGISQLSLTVNLDACGCVTYASPYVEVVTANVQSFGLFGPGGGLSQVTLGFHESDVDIADPNMPSDLSIVAAYPQPPITTSRINKNSLFSESDNWSWTNAGDGSFTAIDLGASASRDLHLFYAGLFFGIAASAIVGMIQAFFTGKERVALRASNESIAGERRQKGQAHTASSEGSISLHDLAGQVTPEIEARLRRHLDRIQADADKRQAVYDRVLRNGRGKSVAEVRELLAREWCATFGIDIPESEFSENAKILAAGNLIKVVVPVRRGALSGEGW